ncbi:MAG: hypothetical protein ACREB9_04530 [Thermoplasmata archaeon]
MGDGVLRLKLPLSDESLAAISDLIAGEKEMSPGRYCFKKVAEQVKQAAELANRLTLSGKVELSATKTLHPADLRDFPLESFDSGSVEILIGPRIKRGIERACALIEGSNRVAGGQPLSWDSSKDWCLRVVQEAMARETAKTDGEDITEEERELYPSPKKDAPSK